MTKCFAFYKNVIVENKTKLLYKSNTAFFYFIHLFIYLSIYSFFQEFDLSISAQKLNMVG